MTHTQKKRFIEKIIKPDQLPAAWPREMKLLGFILKRFKVLKGDQDLTAEFFEKLDLGYQLNSLAFLRSARGKQELFFARERFLLDLETKKEYIVGEKVGEDLGVKLRPANLLNI